MTQERVNEDELYAVLRGHGLPYILDAHAVIQETDGSLAVIRNNGPLKQKTTINLSSTLSRNTWY